jgi:uncharacterized protein
MNFKGLALKLSLVMFVFLGCARVSIDSKQPIKVDVTMRLDIYQHVNKDVDSIENLISGPATGKPKDTALKTSFVIVGVGSAYAEDPEGNFPPDVQQAIDSRKNRREPLVALEARGVVGENYNGLVEMKGSGDDSAASLVAGENSDRKIIYGYVAQKNGASLDETAKIWARRIQGQAPSGTPVEIESGAWSTK